MIRGVLTHRMKIVLISLITIALMAASLSGLIMLASRDGGEGDGVAPGPDIYDGIDDVNDEVDDGNDTGPDEDPYDDEDDDKNNTDLIGGNNSKDPEIPDTNESEPDDNPDEVNEGNDTISDEPDRNETIDNGTDPEPVDPENETDNSTEGDGETDNETLEDNEHNSPYLYTGKIRIEGFGTFEFKPWDIRTTRPDIFAGGHFSLFDILVYLDHEEIIDLDYEFNESMDTFVINSINGSGTWWYWAYYAGGWQESNAWRMDLYPYKDNTTISVYQEESWMIERIYDSFRTQVERRNMNNGRIIIPRVTIQAPSGTLEFNNVEVTAHNLRNDSFREGVITAIDVIMSLGDRGLVTYELEWYETIAGSDPVKNYWVEAVNDDIAHGTCGFVYEAGEEEMGGHNHIHIPSDQRVLTSPEYELFFWICL